MVGEEGFLCDRVQTLRAFDVGVEYEVRNEREAVALEPDNEPAPFHVNRTKKHGYTSVEKPAGR